MFNTRKTPNILDEWNGYPGFSLSRALEISRQYLLLRRFFRKMIIIIQKKAQHCVLNNKITKLAVLSTVV